MSQLEHIYLSKRKIKSIPCDIDQFYYVTGINLRECYYYGMPLKIPQELENLTQLVSLELSNCNLSVIPNTIFNLINLKLLSLYCNKIRRVQKKIAKLINLEVLDLYDNSIKQYTYEIGNIPSIKYVYVYGCPIILTGRIVRIKYLSSYLKEIYYK